MISERNRGAHASVRRAALAKVSQAPSQRTDQAVDFGPEKCGGAVIPEDKISELNLLRQRQLFGHSLPGEHPRQSALLQSGELTPGSTRDAHGEIKPILQRLFKQQGRFHDPTRVGRAGERLSPERKHPRVNKLFQPAALDIIRKNPGPQRGPVDCPILGQHPLAVPRTQGSLYVGGREHLFPNQNVRIEAKKPALFEQARHR